MTTYYQAKLFEEITSDIDRLFVVTPNKLISKYNEIPDIKIESLDINYLQGIIDAISAFVELQGKSLVFETGLLALTPKNKE